MQFYDKNVHFCTTFVGGWRLVVSDWQLAVGGLLLAVPLVPTEKMSGFADALPAGNAQAKTPTSYLLLVVSDSRLGRTCDE